MGNCWSFQSNPEYYPSAILDAHNYYRAHHLSPPLELDKDLCKEASMHANLCAYHKKPLKSRRDRERGENIFSHGNRDADDKEIKDSELWTHCYRAVNSWYETIKYHTFSKSWKDNEKSRNSNQLFQLVPKTKKVMGFAKYIILDRQKFPFADPLCYMLWKESRTLGVGFARTIDQDKRKRITFIVCLYEPIPKPEKLGENVLMPSVNLLPAAKIKEREMANEPEKKFTLNIKEVTTYELREGWGLKDDLSNVSDWKGSYFSKNPWALKAFNDYVKAQNERRAALIKAKGSQKLDEGNGPSKTNNRRKREALNTNNGDIHQRWKEQLSLTKVSQFSHSSHEEVGKRHSAEMIFVESRALFPEIMGKPLKQHKEPVTFSFQRYFYNV